MADITLIPDDPAAWIWSLDDASPSLKDATWDSLQVSLLLYERYFVDNVFSQVRSPSVPATTTTARTVTQRLSPPVSSQAPTPNRPPSHRSHPHLSPRRPDRHPINPLSISSWNLKSYTRLTRRGSLQVTLVSVTTRPRACTQLTTRWCLVRTISKQTQHDRESTPGRVPVERPRYAGT